MRNILLFVSISLLSLLSACGDHPCSKADMNYRLLGFTEAETDTIILRRFEKNSPVVKDSFVFDPSNAIRFARFGDTLAMVAHPSNAMMQSDHDYQLVFPGASRTITITDIEEEQSSGKKYRRTQCVNEINSCKVDGQPAQFFFTNGIYLRK